MTQNLNVKTTVIGCGGMARHHVRKILANFPGTSFPVMCEPSPQIYTEMSAVFHDASLEAPPNEPDLSKLLQNCAQRVIRFHRLIKMLILLWLLWEFLAF